MKKLLWICTLFISTFYYSQSRTSTPKVNYKEMFKKISDEVLLNSDAYQKLYVLSKNIGPRFSGSSGYAKAETWAETELKNVGAENIWKQEVIVPDWQRGKTTLQIKTEKGGYKTLKTLTLGGSEGTGGKDLTGEIVFVKNMAEFSQMFASDVQDKIIFFNYAFDQTIINPADAYLIAGKYRWSAPNQVSKKGAKAIITRSATSDFDDIPHTGSMYYDEEAKEKIPALTIGAKSADELEKLLKTEKVFAKINSTSGTKGEKKDHNIIGEIKGKSSEVILVGAHLDTWDISEGAHDNGAGVVQCLEVLRVFKALGIQPKHTIRVVLFANEENGVTGGETYAAQVKKTGEKHIFAIESDAGGFTPRGISLDMIPQRRRLVFEWKELFQPYGVHDFDQTYAGQDIQPLKKSNVPLAELVPDMQRYFDIHHTSEDTFDKVNRRELLLGAITMAQIVYMIDMNW